jgi:hypothetical protein
MSIYFKYINYPTFIILVILSTSYYSFGQFRYGNKVAVKISSIVYQKNSDRFKYIYKIIVKKNSLQSLVGFTVELGLKNPKDKNKFFINSQINKNWGGSIDFPSLKPPSFKGAEITWIPLDTLTSLPDQFNVPNSAIFPADSIILILEATSLPSINRYWATGWHTPITEQEYDSLKKIGYQSSEIILPWYLDASTGFIIAPDLPPIKFNINEFINILIHYVDQSTMLSWILDQSASSKYLDYFKNTRSYMKQNNNPVAINVLDSVLTDIEADSGITLTSEAYDLIRYNTEYLKKYLEENPE